MPPQDEDDLELGRADPVYPGGGPGPCHDSGGGPAGYPRGASGNPDGAAGNPDGEGAAGYPGGGGEYPGGYSPSLVLAIAASSPTECTAAALPHCGHTAPTWP